MKYFLICKINRYVIMFFFFFYIKIDFWHGRSGKVMAFIPDNISAHVYLLDNNPIKKTKMAAVSWVFPSGWFSTKTTRVFQRRSWQVYLCRFCRQRKVNLYNFQLFQVVVLILEAALTFFSVQVATTTVCMQWPTRVCVNHSKDAFV